ncbi:unnamed protein product [Schistosoma curassoni]|uniref:Transposase n=1 Tax=Schistosoma curassoni TaxID=6186 RepID=A0A183KMY5_9TREM|nr:unnamed protein product [Schistosoma curassoni]
MVELRGTCVPTNIARLDHHDRQARPPRQGSSYGRALQIRPSGQRLRSGHPDCITAFT